jgi:hypothetical protein
MDTIESLVEEYKERENTLSEKEKAVLETRIWTLRPVEVGTGGKEKYVWLQQILGTSASSSQMADRCRLLGKGEAVDILWTQIMGEMTIKTALDLTMRAAELVKSEGYGFPKAVEEALSEYGRRPQKIVLSGGKSVRKGAPRSKRSSISDAPASTREAAEEVPEEPVDMDGGFWVTIRKMTTSYIESRHQGPVSQEIEDLRKDFEGELKTAFNSFRSRLQNSLSRGKKRISFGEVEEACELLGTDPPKAGGLPDMVDIKKNYRNLVRAYHPDNSNKDQRAVYQRIVSAYALIQDYVRQVTVASSKDGRGRL